MAKYPQGILGPFSGRLGKGGRKSNGSNGDDASKRHKSPSPAQAANRKTFALNARCAAGMKLASDVGLRPIAKRASQHSILTKRLLDEGDRPENLRISSGPGEMVQGLAAEVDTEKRTITVVWAPGGAGRKVFLATISADKTYSDAAVTAMEAGSYIFTYENASAVIACVYAFSTDANDKDVSDTTYYKLD